MPIRRHLQEICEHYCIEIMYAFGSRSQEIRGHIDGLRCVQETPHYDVDIGIKLSQGCDLSVRDKVRLTLELEDLFDVRRVDLSILSDSDPFVAVNIVRGEMLYCKDEYMTDEYELYVLRRAGDLAHLERERLSIIFQEHH